jgi:hypothetical protein
VLVSVVIGTLSLSGCDDGDGMGILSRPRITVNPSDSTEMTLAEDFDSGRLRYQHRLQELRQFYLDEGDMVNIRWSYRELNNLQEAADLAWRGVPVESIVEPPLPERTTELLLVERMVEARSAWLGSVDAIAAYYSQTGQTKKFKQINGVRQRFDPIHTYLYLAAAEFPPLDLRPRDDILEANALYDRAIDLFWGGKGVTHSAVTTSHSKQRESLRLFRQLIDEYPTSDRIALAAYYSADIYKEFFNENYRSVEWYRRAYTWLPEINEPARFQAATIYDIRLNDKIKATELYEAAAQYEQFNQSNVRFSLKRVGEIRAEAEAQRRERERHNLPTDYGTNYETE